MYALKISIRNVRITINNKNTIVYFLFNKTSLISKNRTENFSERNLDKNIFNKLVNFFIFFSRNLKFFFQLYGCSNNACKHLGLFFQSIYDY